MSEYIYIYKKIPLIQPTGSRSRRQDITIPDIFFCPQLLWSQEKSRSHFSTLQETCKELYKMKRNASYVTQWVCNTVRKTLGTGVELRLTHQQSQVAKPRKRASPSGWRITSRFSLLLYFPRFCC